MDFQPSQDSKAEDMLMPLGNQLHPSLGMRSLLVIEDYDKLRAALGHHFEQRGFRVYSATRGKDAEAIAHSLLPQAILLDYDLGSEDAVTIARHLRSILPGSAIVITGGPNNAFARQKIAALDGVNYMPYTHEISALDELIEAMSPNHKK